MPIPIGLLCEYLTSPLYETFEINLQTVTRIDPGAICPGVKYVLE